jgi:hypothetical protein
MKVESASSGNKRSVFLVLSPHLYRVSIVQHVVEIHDACTGLQVPSREIDADFFNDRESSKAAAQARLLSPKD